MYSQGWTMGKVKYIPGVQKEEWDWETLLLMPFWLFCIRATVEWGEREWCWPCGELDMLDVFCPCHQWVTTWTQLKSLTLCRRSELRLAASECGGPWLCLPHQRDNEGQWRLTWRCWWCPVGTWGCAELVVRWLGLRGQIWTGGWP